MTLDRFHPMQLVTVLLWSGLGIAAIQFARQLGNRKSAEFDFLGLLLVGWLTIFAFMAGFSMGLVIAIVNIALAISLLMFSNHFQRYFALAATANLLLALFMRGTIPAARLVLALVTLGGVAYLCWTLFRLGTHREDEAFARVALAAVGLLFFANLLLQNYAIIIPISLTLAAVILGVIFTMITRHYRGHLAVISAISFAWMAVIYWQLNFGK